MRLSPSSRIALGLVALTAALVLIADVLFGVLAEPEKARARERQRMAETVASHAAMLLGRGDRNLLEDMLEQTRKRNSDLASIGVRNRTDSKLVANAGEHANAWKDAEKAADASARISVPLRANGDVWGYVEFAFKTGGEGLWGTVMLHPTVMLAAFLTLVGFAAFLAYTRQVLSHLSPETVIPERVRAAFDTMSEGVAIIDTRGLLLLANSSFRTIFDLGDVSLVGRQIREAMGVDGTVSDDELPWMPALRDGETVAQVPWEVDLQDSRRKSLRHHRTLLINCAPVRDEGQKVRGCIMTLDDQSALQRVNAQLLEVLEALGKSQEEVKRKNVELEMLATRDPLTGCLNRRAFNAKFTELLDTARAQNRKLSCIMCDIDHFKSFNDKYGHAIGDRVLQETARKVFSALRGQDLLCRFGGEEFAIALPDLDAEVAMQVGERIRNVVQHEAGQAIREQEGLSITISVGVAVLQPADPSADGFLDRADKALYYSKRNGRNRVTLADKRILEAVEAAA